MICKISHEQKVLIATIISSDLNLDSKDDMTALVNEYGLNECIESLDYLQKKLAKEGKIEDSKKVNRVKINLESSLVLTNEEIIPELVIDFNSPNTGLIKYNGRSIISNEISTYIDKLLLRQLIRMQYVNLEGSDENLRMTLSDEDLTNSINDWRTELIRTLNRFTGEQYWVWDPSPLEQAKIEKNLINKAWEKIVNQLNQTLRGKIESGISPIALNEIINPLMAIAILNNFDKVIESYSEGDVVINPAYKNKAQIYFGKYHKKGQTIKNASFEGDFTDVDFDRISPRMLQRVIETIPDGNGGYLTMHDINSITRHLVTAINTNPDLTDPNILKLFNKNASYEEKFEALINTLTNNEGVLYSRFKNSTALNSLAQYLKKMRIASDNTIFSLNSHGEDGSSIGSVEEEKTICSEYDLIGQLINVITTMQNLAYTRVTKDGVNINSQSGIRKNKLPLRKKMEQTLMNNLMQRDSLGLYNASYILPNTQNKIITYRDIYSKVFLDHVLKLTGVDLTIDILKNTMESEPVRYANIITTFLHDFGTIVYNQFYGKAGRYTSVSDFESDVKAVFDQMQSLQSYVLFTDFVNMTNNHDESLLYDQMMHALPTQGTPTTIGKWYQNLETWRDSLRKRGYKGTAVHNVFITNPQLRSYIPGMEFNKIVFTDIVTYRQDFLVEKDNKQVVVASRDMEEDEILTQAINHECFELMIKSGISASLIACVSDKVRHPLSMVNALANIKTKDGKLKEFRNLTSEEIFDLFYDLFSTYYNTIEEILIEDYNKLFTALNISLPADNTLDSRIKILEGLTESLIQDGVQTIFDQGGYIEIKPQIHYITTKNGLRFNNTLYYYIKVAKNRSTVSKLLNKAFNETRDFIKENHIPFRLKLDHDEITKFAKILNLDVKELETYVRSHGTNASDLYPSETSKDFENNKKVADEMIRKYVYTWKLFSDADLMVTSKFEYMVKGSKTQYTIDELEKMSEAKLQEVFEDDDSIRVAGISKRYNSLVATTEPVTIGDKFSMPTKARMAFIEPHTHTLFNFNNDASHKQATNDGAILGIGYMDIIESWGYKGKSYNPNTQKYFAVIPGFEITTQIKTAKYSINNERIRNSFDSEDMVPGQESYNLEALFKKATLDAKLPPNFLFMWKNGKSLTNRLLWYKFSNGTARFLGLDANYLPDWEFEDGTKVPLDQVINELELEQTESGIKLETTYDLWKLFGGAFSCEYDSKSGKIVESELSQILVALAVCEYAPKCKETTISKLIDVESAKTGQINVNSKQSVLDTTKKLVWVEYDPSRGGVQNDFLHEAVDSDIPQLGQALAGMAFNGKDPMLVHRLNQALSNIVEYGTEDLEKWFDPSLQEKFKKRLLEELKESLLRNSGVQSTAQNIVEEALTAVSVDFAPLSDRNIFSKISSDLIVKLNKNGIRTRFVGIPVIQNPSHGIYGVWEDVNGNIYNRTALLEKARSLGLTGSPKQLIRQILDNPEYGFGQIEVTDTATITIGDCIIINGERKHIDNPLTLYQLENALNSGIPVYKDLSRKRNLRTRQISFTDSQGIRRNLWNLESTKLRFVVGPKGDGDTIIDQIIQTVGLTEKVKTYNITNEASLLYMQANYKGLANKENPYYYPTYESFLANQKEFVTNVIKSHGEQVIPNRFENEFGTRKVTVNQVLSLIRRTINQKTGKEEIHHTFFEDVVKNRILKVNTVFDGELSKQEYKTTLVRDNDEIVFTDHFSDIFNELPQSITEIDGLYYITDQNGNKLFRVKSRDVKVYLEISKLNNGKTLYVLNCDKNTAKYIINTTEDVNLYYNDKNFPEILSKNSLMGISFDPSKEKLHNIKDKYDPSKLSILDRYIRSEAEKMYMSFRLHLKTISTRIPSQSWQSFLATITVAFTENDSNDGYMNIWEMWMQGSDFDIDKAYTLLFSVDEHGKIHDNGFIDYTSEETILQSLLQEYIVPAKNRKLVPMFMNGDVNESVNEEDNVVVWDPDKPFILDDENHTSVRLSDLDVVGRTHPNTKRLIYNSILKEIHRLPKGTKIVVNTALLIQEKASEGKYPAVATYRWMRDINKYNHTDYIAFTRNQVTAAMWEATSGIENLEAATKPMEAAPVNNEIDNIIRTYSTGKKTRYNSFSPLTIGALQVQNAVGKDNVGISANGIKADAAIQQYYNYYEMLGELNKHFTPNSRFLLHTKDGRSISFEITRAANSVFTNVNSFIDFMKSKYGDTFDGIPGKNNGIHDNDLVKFLKSLQSGNISFDLHPEYYIKDEDENIVLNNWFLRIKNAYQTYIQKYQIIPETNEDYIRFLYFYSQCFEDNAADILSIFISLSTDNAKELRLAMINATPELMSIPIALVTYGVNIQTVLDLCINVLKPIKDAMKVNRFKNIDRPTVVKAIDKCLGSKEIDLITANSLKEICRLTSELRNLTNDFSINLGADPDLVKLQYWINNLSSIKNELEKPLSKAETAQDKRKSTDIANLKALAFGLNINEAVLNDLKQRVVLGTYGQEADIRFDNVLNYCFDQKQELTKLDFLQFLGNAEYRQAFIDYFNILSTGCNVLDVLVSAENFAKLLEKTTRVVLASQQIFCTSAITLSMIELDNEREESNFKDKSARDNDNRSKLLFADLSIGYFLNTLGWSFCKLDILLNFDSLINIPGDPEIAFDLSTNQGINWFMLIVNDNIIPNLPKDNYFVRSLELKHNYTSGTTYHGLRHKIMGPENAIEKRNLNESIAEFRKIMEYQSGLVTRDGKNITLGEVLYVYNLIASTGSMNASTTCMEVISEYSDLPKKFRLVEGQLDKISQDSKGNLLAAESDLLNRSVMENLARINKALNSGTGVGSLANDDKEIDIRKSWVFTKAPIRYPIEIDKAKSKIESEIPGCTVEFIKNELLGNNILSYKARFNYNVKNSEDKLYDDVSGTIQIDGNKIQNAVLESLIDKLKSKLKYVTDFLPSNFSGQIYKGLSKESFNNFIILHINDKVISLILKDLSNNSEYNIIIGSSTEIDFEPVIRTLVINGVKTIIIPENIDTATDEAEILMIDALLELENTGIREKITRLLNLTLELNPGEVISKTNLKQLASFENKKFKKGTSELVKTYVDFVSSSLVDLSLKNKCKFEIERVSKVFNSESKLFYFTPSDENDNSAHSYGDLYSDGFKTYMSLGKKFNGSYILVSLDNDPQIKIVNILDNTNKSYKRIYRLKKSLYEILSPISSKLFTYGKVDKTKSPNDLIIGDKVSLASYAGLEMVVSDIIVNNGKIEFTLHDEVEDNYALLYEEDGIWLITDGIEKQSFAGSEIIPVKRQDTGDNAVIHQLQDGIPEKLIENLTPLTDRIYTNQENGIFVKYSNGQIVINTESGIKLLDPSTITSVVQRFPKILDRHFEVLASTPKFYYRESEGTDPSLRIKGYNFKREEHLVLPGTPKYDLELQGFVKVVGSEIIPDGYKKMNPGERIPTEGDIIVNGREVMLVEKVTESGYFGLTLEINNPSTQRYSTISNTYTNLLTIWTPITSQSGSNIKDAELLTEEGVSDYSKGRRFLEVLSDKFGLEIELKSIPDNDFAYIENNKIVINTAKLESYNELRKSKGLDPISLEIYIMSKGLHEFTHLMLANLQAKDGNMYYELLLQVESEIKNNYKKYEDLINQILTSGRYGNKAEGDAFYQEFIVRWVENSVMQNVDEAIGTLETNENMPDSAVLFLIQRLINEGFSKFVNDRARVLGQNLNGKTTVRNVFAKMQQNVFGFITLDWNLEFIRQNYLDSKYLDKIEC